MQFHAKKLILFGGDTQLLDFAMIAKSKGLEVIVFSDPFRLDVKIEGETSLRDLLNKNEFEVIECDSVSAHLLKPYVTPDTLGVSIVTFWLFDQSIIDLFKGNLINYHGARLPEERGAGIYTWKILMGDFRGGLSLHVVAPQLDKGDLIFERRFDFPKTCKFPIDFLKFKRQEEGIFFNAFLEEVTKNSSFTPSKQDNSQCRYWPPLNTHVNGFIDWNWSAQEICKFINAFSKPYKGASTYYRDQRVFCLDATVVDMSEEFHPFQSGICYRKEAHGVCLSAKGGGISIAEVQDETGQLILKNIRFGYRFYTPPDVLLSAKYSRPKYGPKGLYEVLAPENLFKR